MKVLVLVNDEKAAEGWGGIGSMRREKRRLKPRQGDTPKGETFDDDVEPDTGRAVSPPTCRGAARRYSYSSETTVLEIDRSLGGTEILSCGSDSPSKRNSGEESFLIFPL